MLYGDDINTLQYIKLYHDDVIKWKNFAALLAFCAGNSAVTGELPAQMPATRSFDVFFDLRLNERLSEQLFGWWFERPSRPLWRHSNVIEDFFLEALIELFSCRILSDLEFR